MWIGYLVLFIVGITLLFWGISNHYRFCILLKYGKKTQATITSIKKNKSVFCKNATIKINDKELNVIINPKNHKIGDKIYVYYYDEQEYLISIANYNNILKYSQNILAVYLLCLILILPELLILLKVNEVTAWIGTIVFTASSLVVLLITKVIIIDENNPNIVYKKDMDYKDKLYTKLRKEYFGASLKNEKILYYSKKELYRSLKHIKLFIVICFLIVFGVIGFLYISNMINYIYWIGLTLISLIVLAVIVPSDEGIDQVIVIKKNCLEHFIVHTDNEYSSEDEWYELNRITKVKNFRQTSLGFVIEGEIERTIRNKKVNSSLKTKHKNKYFIPSFFENDKAIYKKLSELEKK